jgi:peptidyl-prolyl cis-trans isomerase C
MKLTSLFLFAPLIAAFAQAPAPAPAAAEPPPASESLPADAVVATSAGQKITAGEVRKIAESLPAQMRQNFTRDPKGFVNQWLLLKKLVAIAEGQKLHEKSPYKEGLELARMQVLFQAAVDVQQAQTAIAEEDIKKAYEARKDGQTRAAVKIVYVPFASGPAPGGAPQRTEKEAIARAEEVVKKARAGADFAALVKEYSEDPISKEKNGDFGPIKRGDQLPEPVKQAVFALKKDEISDPIRQPNGYYIFKLMDTLPATLDEMRDQLFTDLKNERMRQWMDANVKAVEIKVERPEFFQPGAVR